LQESFKKRAAEAGLFWDGSVFLKRSGKEEKHGRVFFKAENIVFKYAQYDKSSFKITVDNFYLKSGEITALIGKNGSGKSTFAKIISGLLPVESGRITADVETDNGGVLKEASADYLNRNVAYFFQNPDSQLFLPTVREELMFGFKDLAAAKKLSGKEIEEAVNAAILLFKLDNPDMPPSIMSYGERKRLQAAIYYLLNKKIVIMDEADSGLSFRDYLLIVENFINLDPPPAILIISHDVKFSRKIADRTLVAKENSILEFDAATDEAAEEGAQK
jgi:energy-coupling factor transporter ATP-binding protein EcfA2